MGRTKTDILFIEETYEPRLRGLENVLAGGAEPASRLSKMPWGRVHKTEARMITQGKLKMFCVTGIAPSTLAVLFFCVDTCVDLRIKTHTNVDGIRVYRKKCHLA